MRVTFQEELDQLEASLQEEGSLVLRVLRGSLNALAQRDVELADDVIAFDDDVDRLFLQIEILLHEPAHRAGDPLRDEPAFVCQVLLETRDVLKEMRPGLR